MNILLELARRQTNGLPIPRLDEEEAAALTEGLSSTNEWEFQAFIALNKHLKKALDATLQQSLSERN